MKKKFFVPFEVILVKYIKQAINFINYWENVYSTMRGIVKRELLNIYF